MATASRPNDDVSRDRDGGDPDVGVLESRQPHYILLIGIVIITVFLGIEARRYRDYDVFQSRVRILQENLLATALDPSQGVEHVD